jgi:hypothetical protein
MKALEKKKIKGTLPHLCLQPLFSNVAGVKRVKVKIQISVWGLGSH